MSHRPYPNADRALRQLDRHGRTVPPMPVSEFSLRLAQQVNAVLEAVGAAMRPLSEAVARSHRLRQDDFQLQR